MALEDFMWAMLFSAIVVLILIAVDYVDPQQVVANPSMQKVAVLVAVVAVSIVALERLVFSTSLGTSFKKHTMLFLVSSSLASSLVIFYFGLFGVRPYLREFVTGETSVKIVDDKPTLQ